jgi:ribosomal protein L21E
MQQFTEGDRVRVDIPDTTDPDFDRYHGAYGTVIKILDDDADRETGDERDSHLYRIEVDNGSITDMRWRDLRPLPEAKDSE